MTCTNDRSWQLFDSMLEPLLQAIVVLAKRTRCELGTQAHTLPGSGTSTGLQGRVTTGQDPLLGHGARQEGARGGGRIRTRASEHPYAAPATGAPQPHGAVRAAVRKHGRGWHQACHTVTRRRPGQTFCGPARHTDEGRLRLPAAGSQLKRPGKAPFGASPTFAADTHLAVANSAPREGSGGGLSSRSPRASDSDAGADSRTPVIWGARRERSSQFPHTCKLQVLLCNPKSAR